LDQRDKGGDWYNGGILWLRRYWPEAMPVVVLLAWKIPFRHAGEPSDLLLTLPLLAIGLAVLVFGLRYVKRYHRPLTTALWALAFVVVLTGGTTNMLINLQDRPYGTWPWAFAVLALFLAGLAMVVWLSGRLARHGLRFAVLLCAAYLAYSFTDLSVGFIDDRPAVFEGSLRVAAVTNVVAAGATIAVLIRRFPALGRDAQWRGVLLLLAFPLVNALIRWTEFTVYPSYEGTGWDRVTVAASFSLPYVVFAAVLLGATCLVARRYRPEKA